MFTGFPATPGMMSGELGWNTQDKLRFLRLICNKRVQKESCCLVASWGC
jgi:hypothetical protein